MNDDKLDSAIRNQIRYSLIDSVPNQGWWDKVVGSVDNQIDKQTSYVIWSKIVSHIAMRVQPIRNQVTTQIFNQYE